MGDEEAAEVGIWVSAGVGAGDGTAVCTTVGAGVGDAIVFDDAGVHDDPTE